VKPDERSGPSVLFTDPIPRLQPPELQPLANQ